MVLPLYSPRPEMTRKPPELPLTQQHQHRGHNHHRQVTIPREKINVISTILRYKLFVLRIRFAWSCLGSCKFCVICSHLQSVRMTFVGEEVVLLFLKPLLLFKLAAAHFYLSCSSKKQGSWAGSVLFCVRNIGGPGPAWGQLEQIPKVSPTAFSHGCAWAGSVVLVLLFPYSQFLAYSNAYGYFLVPYIEW